MTTLTETPTGITTQITPASISLATAQSSSTLSSPTAVASSSMKTNMRSQSTNQSLSLQNFTTAIVFTHNDTLISNADHGSTEGGFFDHPSNMASTIGAVSALCLASVILCVLASKFTAAVRLER